jgi:hypothetical protein
MLEKFEYSKGQNLKLQDKEQRVAANKEATDPRIPSSL